MASIRELNSQDTHLAYLAMAELRPHLASLDDFVHQVNQEQRPEGYRLVASFEEEILDAVAVAGFRTGHNLAFGHNLYVDDLVTQSAFRKLGHAESLMAWLVEEAQRLGCLQIHLDSAVHRHDAHRFYLNQRMYIFAYHFNRGLS
jgi:GNAT superfamily N-acetyltransferase